MSRWFEWFMPKEVESDDSEDELKSAILANRAATQERIRLDYESQKKYRSIISLSENALKILESQDTRKKR